MLAIPYGYIPDLVHLSTLVSIIFLRLLHHNATFYSSSLIVKTGSKKRPWPKAAVNNGSTLDLLLPVALPSQIYIRATAHLNSPLWSRISPDPADCGENFIFPPTRAEADSNAPSNACASTIFLDSAHFGRLV
jgi:hypothetical protein